MTPDMNGIEQWQTALSNIQIHDPIRTLFRPRLSLRVEPGFPELELRCTIWAPDREGTGEQGPVVHRMWLPQESPMDNLPDLVRRMLKIAVTHEVDESILVAGERIYDPHKPQERKIRGPKQSK